MALTPPLAEFSGHDVDALPGREQALSAYLIVVTAAMAAALVTGRPEPAAVAAPFVVALLVGTRHLRAIPLQVDIALERAQVIEGDDVHLWVRVHGPRWMRVETRIQAGPGLDEPEQPAWASGPGPVAERRTTLVAQRWGRLETGTVVLRVRAPYSLVRWTTPAVTLPPLRVLPRSERLTALLDPAASHAAAGAHRARRRVGHGSEFAEIRPYQPGDRLRDLNWAASARRGTPHVNRHHPELSGDVVVMIDTSFDAISDTSEVGQQALVRCARAAWAVTRLHLGAQDRVGLLAAGRVTRWLQPAAGTRARYAMLESLLDIGGLISRRAFQWERAADERVPPAALVVGLTPLWEDRFSIGLVSLARRGRAVVALALDSADLLPPPQNDAEQLARRLFQLEFDDRVARLRHAGVPTVVWPANGSADAALGAAARLATARRVVSA